MRPTEFQDLVTHHKDQASKAQYAEALALAKTVDEFIIPYGPDLFDGLAAAEKTCDDLQSLMRKFRQPIPNYFSRFVKCIFDRRDNYTNRLRLQGIEAVLAAEAAAKSVTDAARQRHGRGIDDADELRSDRGELQRSMATRLVKPRPLTSSRKDPNGEEDD